MNIFNMGIWGYSMNVFTFVKRAVTNPDCELYSKKCFLSNFFTFMLSVIKIYEKYQEKLHTCWENVVNVWITKEN